MKNEARRDRFFTIPNMICLLRMLGSIVLVVLAVNGRDQFFLWLFVALAISDWVDGKLAILLNQHSIWGPSLDSWADAGLYLALLIGAVLLRGDVLQSELKWILPALGSYGFSTLAGCWKYRRWPSYHTRAAKTSWFLILVGAGCLFGGWNLWPLRMALAAVILTNLEALLITTLVPGWRSDVGSVFQILRERARHRVKKNHPLR
jgi:CDP-diacylglycerol--glycerol-3-phosphate 3-phosphatidyltransferase